MIKRKYFYEFVEVESKVGDGPKRFRIRGIDDYQRVLDLLGYDSNSRGISDANDSSDVEEVETRDSDSDVADDVNTSLPDQELRYGRRGKHCEFT